MTKYVSQDNLTYYTGLVQGMPDGVTIEYSSNGGSENLHVIGIPDNIVGSDQAKQSMFTDDTSSTASASDKIAATPKMVFDSVMGPKDVYLYQPSGYIGLSGTSFYDFQNSSISAVGQNVLQNQNNIVINNDAILIINISVAYYSTATISILVDDESIYSYQASSSTKNLFVIANINSGSRLSIKSTGNGLANIDSLYIQGF